MGISTRLMEEHEEKVRVAMGIALKAGVLKCCEFHEDCIFEGSGDIEAAYRFGNSSFSAGALGEAFESRREMTDYIKGVVEWNHAADECPRCLKNLEE